MALIIFILSQKSDIFGQRNMQLNANITQLSGKIHCVCILQLYTMILYDNTI